MTAIDILSAVIHRTAAVRAPHAGVSEPGNRGQLLARDKVPKEMHIFFSPKIKAVILSR
jgi:hypothetical protein